TAYQQIGCRFACGVRAVGRQRGFFGKGPGGAEAPVDLICTYLHHASDFHFPRGVEQHLGAEDVGADERPGIVDAPIDVTFRSEVTDAVDVRGGGGDRGAVGDATVNEAVARVPFQVAQVRQVAGVGQAVEVDHADLRVGFQQIADEVAADEAATPRHHHRKHGIPPTKLPGTVNRSEEPAPVPG